MDLYFDLLHYPVFTFQNVEQKYHNVNSAKAAIRQLEKSGRIVRIRRGLYTPVSGETKAPVANRFQIASALTPTSAVSHHSAMEYYGITDQVFYEVYVSSASRFTDFSFDGYTYRYIRTMVFDGVICPKFSGGIRITDKERTVIDSINDIDEIAGPEEVVENICSIRNLNEQKMLQYLASFHSQFLYQKVGYFLSHLTSCSDEFLEKCLELSGKSTRYLLNDDKTGKYDAKWRLVVPDSVLNMKNGEMEDLYAVI